MQESGCPSFKEVGAYIFCSVLSFAMILTLLHAVFSLGARQPSTVAWVFIVAFSFVIAYCCVGLIRGLFPLWFGVGRSGVLVREVIEIEGVR